MAKARLGFSSELADACRAVGLEAGRELEEMASVVMLQDLGAGGSLDKGRGQEELQGCWGTPSLPHLALEAPSAVPAHDGCPGFTSESLTGQQGEKVNPLDLSP